MNSEPCVFLVDDDEAVRDSLSMVLEADGLCCKAFASGEEFLERYTPGKSGCLVLDVNMPGLDGLEVQSELGSRNINLPIIFLTAYGDIPMSVRAVKAGATDFLTKPVASELLLERVRSALLQEIQICEQNLVAQEDCNLIYSLTPRELEIMILVVEGLSNKEIGRKLGISYRTVEIHRSRIMHKTGSGNLLELARLHNECRFCLNPPSV